ncbi:MAG TPA: Holliday junction branch migration protein RuvA [Anaerolineaceae bacterium]|nr:Holliday junction branch migration protein RuvA [Anaerolineaceae bacterium]HQO98126.1 Holliday junction branch migration protein RuvA [Anaerolineaceae bacterium]HQP61623.1 Holliday junction branch migration protein RuvA [Anaerolineaceae bacterium]
MISLIRGLVAGRGDDCLIIQVGGVGLRVYVSPALLLQANVGSDVSLHTHLVVREDSLTLYGFLSEEERDLYVLLLGADGVGPRIGLNILSTLSVDAIRRAVLAEQPDIFSRVSGVGRKTAQKILLHLQGKIKGEVSGELIRQMDADAEVLEALVGLGYSVVEAQAAIQSIPKETSQDVETRLRIALQYFSN